MTTKENTAETAVEVSETAVEAVQPKKEAKKKATKKKATKKATKKKATKKAPKKKKANGVKTSAEAANLEYMDMPSGWAERHPQFQNSRHRPSVDHIKSLKESIINRGVLTPLIYWKVPSDKVNPKTGEKFHMFLVSGSCRQVCIDQIREEYPEHLPTTPARIYTGDIKGAAAINLAENIQREDLSPIEVCEYLLYMRDTLGVPGTEMASLVNKSTTYVSLGLKFMDNSSRQLLTAVKDGKLSYTLAQEISEVPVTQQVEFVAEYLDCLERKGKKEAVKETRDKLPKPKKEEVTLELVRDPAEIIQLYNGYRTMDLSEQSEKVRSFVYGIQVALAFTLKYNPDFTKIQPFDVDNIDLTALPGQEAYDSATALAVSKHEEEMAEYERLVAAQETKDAVATKDEEKKLAEPADASSVTPEPEPAESDESTTEASA